MHHENPLYHTEADAAALLGKSVRFLQRERRQGNIGYTTIGKTPVYLPEHLQQYLKARQCPSASKSAATGSASGPTAPTTTPHGTILPLDKRAAHRSALAILKPPNKH